MPTEETLIVKDIAFANGNQAKMVSPLAGKSPKEILAALGISKCQAVIIVSGGAEHVDQLDNAHRSRLYQLFSRGIARAAVERQALVIDGGTQSGIMEMMGLGIADRSPEDPQHRTTLLGVAPVGKVTYPGGPDAGSIQNGAALDPNHTHFVLASGAEWGGETKTLFALAAELKEAHRIPIVVILTNGNAIAQSEILHAVRHGWPIIVLDGSGGLADTIAQQHRKKVELDAQQIDPSQHSKSQLSIDNPDLAEIVEEGNLQVFAGDANVARLKDFVLQLLHTTKAEVLELAWRRFALYDTNAARHQNLFRLLKNWPLLLAVTSITLVVTRTVLLSTRAIPEGSLGDSILRLLIIVAPIVTSVFLAAETRMKSGSKWLVLRSSAEALKRDIYGYRALAGLPHDKPIGLPTTASELATHIENVNTGLMKTDANEAGLTPYTGKIPPRMYGAAESDDGFSPLTPENYVAIRVGDQLSYYRLRISRLEKQLRRLQWSILIFGGVGAVLAAVSLEALLPLTVAVATALTAYMEYQQVEQSIIKYNQTESSLTNLLGRWSALSAEERANPQNILNLVNTVESVLETEIRGWVQEFQKSQTQQQVAPDGTLIEPGTAAGKDSVTPAPSTVPLTVDQSGARTTIDQKHDAPPTPVVASPTPAPAGDDLNKPTVDVPVEDKDKENPG